MSGNTSTPKKGWWTVGADSEVEDPTWMCADGRAVRVSEMTTQHLKNTRGYLYTKCKEFGHRPHQMDVQGKTARKWINIFDEELKFRERTFIEPVKRGFGDKLAERLRRKKVSNQ